MAYISNSTNNTIIPGTSEADEILNFGSRVTIHAGAGDDSIGAHVDNVSINAGAGNDTIQNSGNNVTILGGKGNDSLNSYGTGTVYIYNSGDGNDNVEYFGLFDTLVITGAKFTRTQKDGYALVKVGKHTITLSGVSDVSKVNIVTSTKNISPVNIIDNHAGNTTVKGKSSSNVIKSYGANVSINGGKGNDSLWGNAGKDMFIYGSGDGKDVIYGFGDDDLLKITGTFSGTYSKSKSEVYFKVGSTSKAITLSDFTATTFNVNGSAYKISGTKLIRN